MVRAVDVACLFAFGSDHAGPDHLAVFIESSKCAAHHTECDGYIGESLALVAVLYTTNDTGKRIG